MTDDTGDIAVEPSGITRAGATAAIALIALLAIGLIPGPSGPWGLRNWLALLHGANLGGGGAFDALRGVRAIDLAILLIGGVAFLGMRPVLGSANRAGVGVAAAVPLAGIVVLLYTGFEGRSALMVGGLVLGWRMTKRDRFRLSGWTGVAANGLLLLAGAATTDLPDPAAADIVAAGYALFIAWLAWIAVRMLRPLRGRPVPVGTHHVGAGGGCRTGGSETTEVFDLPLYSPEEGALGTYFGVADASTRFTVDEAEVSLIPFLEAYDAGGSLEVRAEERGRLAAMTMDTAGARG
jgi:hypothetical protein